MSQIYTFLGLEVSRCLVIDPWRDVGGARSPHQEFDRDGGLYKIYQHKTTPRGCLRARGLVFLSNGMQAIRFSKSVLLPKGVTNAAIERRGRSWVIKPEG